MAKTSISNVTMRIRVGENELEVTGPSDFVEKKINEFLKQQEKISSLPQTQYKPQGKVVKEPTTGKKISVAQFLRNLTSKSLVDKVLGAGYYLEKYNNHESFTAHEIREIIKSAKAVPPRNPNDAINNNIKKGLIMSAGDKDGNRAFVLTTDGEDVINEMLSE